MQSHNLCVSSMWSSASESQFLKKSSDRHSLADAHTSSGSSPAFVFLCFKDWQQGPQTSDSIPSLFPDGRTTFPWKQPLTRAE